MRRAILIGVLIGAVVIALTVILAAIVGRPGMCDGLFADRACRPTPEQLLR